VNDVFSQQSSACHYQNEAFMARLDARHIVELAEGWVAPPREPCYPPADRNFRPWAFDSSWVVVKLILLWEVTQHSIGVFLSLIDIFAKTAHLFAIVCRFS
jgi:hypothetical protein